MTSLVVVKDPKVIQKTNDLDQDETKKSTNSKITLEKLLEAFKDEVVTHMKINEPKQPTTTDNFPLAKRSLFIFSQDNLIRRLALQIIESRWFNYFIFVLIIANSMLMAITDYSSRLTGSDKQAVLFSQLEIFFGSCYLLEFVLKIIAMGFCMEKNTYLREGWNLIDFSVVVSTIISFIPNLPNIGILKAFRVLRPLRSLKAIKGIRILVESLIDSFPAFTNVLFFVAFFVLFFGILGIQLFSGIFEQRCRLTPLPINNIWRIDDNYTMLCEKGVASSCPSGDYCGAPFEYNIPFNETELNTPDLLYGILNFNNIFYSSLVIFSCLVIDGWTTITYIYAHGYNSEIVKMYFTFVTVFGGLFLVNLILAVINQSFEKFQEESKSNAKGNNYESPEKIMNTQSSNPEIAKDFFDFKQIDILVYSKETKEVKQKNKFRKKLQKIIESQAYLAILTFTIIFNTIFLASDHYPMSSSFSNMLTISNLAFTIFFFLEMILKIYAFKPSVYVKDKMNIFDVFIVWSSILEIILEYVLPVNSNNISGISALAALRTFRLFRMFKILRAWPDLKNMIKALIESLISLKFFSILLFIFMVISTFMGNELFAYRIRFISDTQVAPDGVIGYSKRINFDTFLNGMITIFIILTNQSWFYIMFDHIRALNDIYVCFFFIIVLIIGNFLLLNLFLAILINNFGESADKLLQKDKTDKPKFFLSKFLSSFKKKNTIFPEKNSALTSNQILMSHKNSSEHPEKSLEIQKSEAHDALEIEEYQLASIENFDKNKNVIYPISNEEQAYFQNLPTVHKKSSEDNNGTKNKELPTDNSENLIMQSEKKPSHFSSIKVSSSFKRSKFLKEELNGIKKLERLSKEIFITGNSFYIFGPKNRLRRFCFLIENNQKFDYIIIICILTSSCLLVLDNPLTDPKDKIMTFINTMDIVTTVIFSIEIIIKVISKGFIFSKNSYLRNPWNILDFSIVACAGIYTFGISNISINVVKVFRLSRVLRPLRLISRNEGMKVTINSLIRALPNIFNLVMLNAFFFLLFGIMGITLFKGEFYFCDNIPNNFASSIIDNIDCYDYGGDWVNAVLNFDHIGRSTMYLFVMSTREAWVDAMHAGQDSVAPNKEPITNYNQYMALYFIFYIIIGSYLMLNLFVGIVFESFKKEKSNLEGVSFLTRNQLEWMDIQINIMKLKPKEEEKVPENRIGRFFYNIVTNSVFEKFIIISIILNAIVFTLYWNRQSAIFTEILTDLNLVFLAIFAFEAFSKIVAFGFDYFHSGWNVLDFVVVILGIIGAALEYFITFDLGTSSSIIRTFRIFRLIRLIKKAKSLNMIFNTFVLTLPALANIGSLLMLGLFIFSIIAMNNFAYLKDGNEIDNNANFRNFANSFFTLLRVSTGENWDGILEDSVAYPRPDFVCYQINNYYDYVKYGFMGCGTSLAYVFFIIFEIFFAMVFMNLFIAVVLEGFYQSHIEYDLHVSANDLAEFQILWREYDSNALGFIYVDLLEDFLLKLDGPLGWKRKNYTKKERRLKISHLCIPVYSIKRVAIPLYSFYDVAKVLAEAALTDEFNIKEICSETKSNPMKIIEKKRKKFVKTLTHIIKTDLVSAHIIAGKIIFEKVFKFKKKNHQNDYIDKFLLERGIVSHRTAFISNKIDEIKTPQIKKKLTHLINSMNLEKSTSFDLESEKKNIIQQNYRNMRMIRKIASSKVINIKYELANGIFNLNKSFDMSKPEVFSPKKKIDVEICEKKGGSKKIISDMKNIFEL